MGKPHGVRRRDSEELLPLFLGRFWQSGGPLDIDSERGAFATRLEHSEQHAVGTVEEVHDKLVRQWKMLPAVYIVFIVHYAQRPKEYVIDDLDRFM